MFSFSSQSFPPIVSSLILCYTSYESAPPPPLTPLAALALCVTFHVSALAALMWPPGKAVRTQSHTSLLHRATLSLKKKTSPGRKIFILCTSHPTPLLFGRLVLKYERPALDTFPTRFLWGWGGGSGVYPQVSNKEPFQKPKKTR